MNLFDHEQIDFKVLKKRAFNLRWAEMDEGILPLTAADSDFPCAKEINEDLIEYINGGYFSYTPKMGFTSLKESIAKAMWERKQEKINPEFVLPIDSAARAMSIIAKAFLHEEDEFIVFDPVDFLFKKSMDATGAKCVYFPANIKDGHIDLSHLKDYITPKTKMLGLCNPHNPLGMLYTKEDLTLIQNLCYEHDIYIMNDEIWSDIVYPPNKFISILQLDEKKNDKVCTVYGFSKAFGVAGLRAGCIYAQNQAIFDEIVEASEVMSTIGGISSLSQIAAQTCLDKCYYWVDGFVEQLKKNRDYGVERINRMPYLHVVSPDATFVLFINVMETGMTSEEFVNFMKEKVKLALVPGSDAFFGPNSAGYVRLCFSTSDQILKEGLDRLEAGIKLIEALK
ncbi:MAG: pyridoxal phosphate-dependent aminotransferase [Erysipelotrichaceae bacterium]